jgi:hypothetical protein
MSPEQFAERTDPGPKPANSEQIIRGYARNEDGRIVDRVRLMFGPSAVYETYYNSPTRGAWYVCGYYYWTEKDGKEARAFFRHLIRDEKILSGWHQLRWTPVRQPQGAPC